jgi:hypothetical protein
MLIRMQQRLGLVVYKVYYKNTMVAEFLSYNLARDYLNRLNNTINKLRS